MLAQPPAVQAAVPLQASWRPVHSVAAARPCVVVASGVSPAAQPRGAVRCITPVQSTQVSRAATPQVPIAQVLVVPRSAAAAPSVGVPARTAVAISPPGAAVAGHQPSFAPVVSGPSVFPAAGTARVVSAPAAFSRQPMVQVPTALTQSLGLDATATGACSRPTAAPAPAAAERCSAESAAELDALTIYRRSGLREVPVAQGLAALRRAGGSEGRLARGAFLCCYEELLRSRGLEVPPAEVRAAVFDLVDRDGNGVVDLMELVSGVSLLCGGTDDEKLHAVFSSFDENDDGFISMEEMFKFLTSVFRVGLTPQALAVVNSMGTTVTSAEELAAVTAVECFGSADLNVDGRLSIAEFKAWFDDSGHDPAFLFSPFRNKHLNF